MVKKATTRVERTEAKVGGASFYKYNESVNEYYMAEFQLLHDKLTLKDAELALSHLQWGAALEREQRLCAIGLESTKITREALWTVRSVRVRSSVGSERSLRRTQFGNGCRRRRLPRRRPMRRVTQGRTGGVGKRQ